VDDPGALHVGIVELGDLCAGMRAGSLALFELVGSWVSTTDRGALQRLFAEACHRHAWHADLWAQRYPTIPGPDVEAATAPHRARPAIVEKTQRVTWYRQALDNLVADLEALQSRLDPDLDPATVRTAELVAADAHAVLGRLDQI
jgi:hypothetical protein